MTPELKLEKLKELVNTWVNYLDLWKNVTVHTVTKTEKNNTTTVTIRDEYGREREGIHTVVEEVPPTTFVRVIWHTPKGKWKNILHPKGFEAKEFPLSDIDKRIDHYKYKLRSIKEKLAQ